MLDPKLLRNSPDIVNRALKKRGFETDAFIDGMKKIKRGKNKNLILSKIR